MDMDEIYESLIAGVESRSGVRINGGGDMALRLKAVAAELASLWAHVDWVKKQCFPQSAAGQLLDCHGAVRALERRKGTRAKGEIYFEADGAAVNSLSVPAGTACLSLSGLEFVTLQDAVIAPGEDGCTVETEASESGSAGNVPEGSICQMVLAPVGIARCRNTGAFTGGADDEDDESFRARIMASYARLPNGSNAAYYETEALNTKGVAAAAVFPRRRGLGTVDVVVASESFPPTEELLGELEERFGAEREICVDVQVLPPKVVSVDVTAVVDTEPGYDPAEVRENVKVALNGLFDGRLLGKDLLLARLGNVIFNVEGVANYAFTAPAADVKIEKDELPVAGTITVTGR